ncbi:hypothetical protein GGR54DRAFT_626707 [Hypoxylon sp. NC1633]|nr:hypothetical protein GGR54DRAFT_626707 [Hypoxylon sp. NC1633]
MPPKRGAPSTSASANKRARSKSPTDDPPQSSRWSAVSGSANADADYKTTWKNPDKSYSFVTICSPLRNEDDDDEEDEDKEDDDKKEAGEGCGRKNCVCLKPVNENPEHPWVISHAGYRKYVTQRIHLQLRDPDNFGMYTYNDHAAYGGLEVVENLLLDYDEATERGWKEQWAVCEGLGLFLLSPMSGIVTMADDGERVNEAFRLVGRMFLNMLAKLDEQDLVGDATEVRNLGTIMAVYIKIASDLRPYGILEHDDDEKGRKKFTPEHYDDAVLSYANHRGVTLQGPKDIDNLTAELNGDNVKLVKKGAKHPWSWKFALTKYTQRHGNRTIMTGKKKSTGIGGDALDITTWSSAQRKEASFNKKDPLGKREIDAIKQGLVFQLG